MESAGTGILSLGAFCTRNYLNSIGIGRLSRAEPSSAMKVPAAGLGVDRPQPGGEDDAADGVDVAAESHAGRSVVFNGFRSKELLLGAGLKDGYRCDAASVVIYAPFCIYAHRKRPLPRWDQPLSSGWWVCLIEHVHHHVSALLPLRIEFLPKAWQGLVLSIEFDKPVMTEHGADRFLIHKNVSFSFYHFILIECGSPHQISQPPQAPRL